MVLGIQTMTDQTSRLFSQGMSPLLPSDILVNRVCSADVCQPSGLDSCHVASSLTSLCRTNTVCPNKQTSTFTTPRALLAQATDTARGEDHPHRSQQSLKLGMMS